MDVLFALIGLFLLTEFFYFVRHPIGKPLPLSKTTKLIAGSVGLVGAIVMILMLKADIVPRASSFTNDSVVLPTFDWAIKGWVVGLTVLVGIIENAALVYMGIVGGTTRLANPDRQAKALEYVLEHGSLTIQEFEHLFPGITRPLLEQDMKAMVGMGLLESEGSTENLVYRMKRPR